MSRSVLLNQVLKGALAESGCIIINDGEEDHYCYGFKEACAVIDSVEECFIKLFYHKAGKVCGWAHVIPDLDADEQIADYAAGSRLSLIIERVTARMEGESA